MAGEEDVPLGTAVELPFLPRSRPASHIAPFLCKEVFELASSTLSGGKVSLGARFKDHFRTTPTVRFNVQAELPLEAVTGGSYNVKVLLDIFDMSSDVAVIPPVHITLKTLKLHSTTFYRAPRDTRRASSWRDKQRTLSDSALLLDCAKGSTFAPKAGQPGGSRWDFQAAIPASLIPNFVSFAISCAYTIKLALQVDIAGKKFNLKAETPPLHISVPPAPSQQEK